MLEATTYLANKADGAVLVVLIVAVVLSALATALHVQAKAWAGALIAGTLICLALAFLLPT